MSFLEDADAQFVLKEDVCTRRCTDDVPVICKLRDVLSTSELVPTTLTTKSTVDAMPREVCWFARAALRSPFWDPFDGPIDKPDGGGTHSGVPGSQGPHLNKGNLYRQFPEAH